MVNDFSAFLLWLSTIALLRSQILRLIFFSCFCSSGNIDGPKICHLIESSVDWYSLPHTCLKDSHSLSTTKPLEKTLTQYSTFLFKRKPTKRKVKSRQNIILCIMFSPKTLSNPKIGDVCSCNACMYTKALITKSTEWKNYLSSSFIVINQSQTTEQICDWFCGKQVIIDRALNWLKTEAIREAIH